MCKSSNEKYSLMKVAVSLYSFCSLRFLNRWSVDEHGILEIRQLNLKDFGVFQCVAKNLLSEGDRRTYLVVTGKHSLFGSLLYRESSTK